MNRNPVYVICDEIFRSQCTNEYWRKVLLAFGDQDGPKVAIDVPEKRIIDFYFEHPDGEEWIRALDRGPRGGKKWASGIKIDLMSNSRREIFIEVCSKTPERILLISSELDYGHFDAAARGLKLLDCDAALNHFQSADEKRSKDMPQDGNIFNINSVQNLMTGENATVEKPMQNIGNEVIRNFLVAAKGAVLPEATTDLDKATAELEGEARKPLEFQNSEQITRAFTTLASLMSGANATRQLWEAWAPQIQSVFSHLPLIL